MGHDQDPACDARWEFCASPDDAELLLRYLEGAKRWIRDATTACGPVKEAP